MVGNAIAGIIKDDGRMYYLSIPTEGNLVTDIENATKFYDWGMARSEIFIRNFNTVCLGWFVLEEQEDGTYEMRDNKTCSTTYEKSLKKPIRDVRYL